MSYIPITPFGRSVDVTLIEHEKVASNPLPASGANKYDILRDLTVCRTALGISHRALGVLQALLSFHPETVLGGSSTNLVVFPSNASICERLNGMPCSTMRRHLTVLVKTGLIIRRDSPNGKRYVKRYGQDKQAFGFDLTPLVVRSGEFGSMAESIRTETDRYQRLRRSVSLMRRDLAGLAGIGAQMDPESPHWAACGDLASDIAIRLRRKLTFAELEALEAQLKAGLDLARNHFDLQSTVNLSTNDAENEHHHLNSNKDGYRSERVSETSTYESKHCEDVNPSNEAPNVPIRLVTESCKEIASYCSDKIRHWFQLVRAAESVRPMMGISQTVWDEAIKVMGVEEASVSLACILERFAEIKSPSAYLRSLSKKASQGRFSSAPMVMALLRKDEVLSSQL